MKDWGFGNDKPLKRDPITQPPHYTQGKLEVIEAIMLLGLDPCAGNVLKYIARHTMKGGKDDLLKAREYINLMLKNYDNWYSDPKGIYVQVKATNPEEKDEDNHPCEPAQAEGEHEERDERPSADSEGLQE